MKKNVEQIVKDLVERFGADEIFDALADELRTQSYNAQEPLGGRLHAAASIAFGAAVAVRENWRGRE